MSAIRERPVQRYSEVFGLGAEGQGFVVVSDFKLTFSFLVVEVEGCRHLFVVLNFSFQSGGIHLQLPCPWSAPPDGSLEVFKG